MTDAYALRNMVEAEQADFTALLRGLTPEQWRCPSLCRGWSVHDTVIHIAMHAHTRPVERFSGLARVGFSEDRQMEPERARPTDDLIDWLASPAKLGGRFDILTQLSELVIHQQDVRRPLDVARGDPSRTALRRTRLRHLPKRPDVVDGVLVRRAKGLRLVATDIDWWAGTGAEVCGPGEAILMALNGRADAIPELEGDGTRLLAGRIKS